MFRVYLDVHFSSLQSITMKKQLSLLALLALGVPVASAATLDLGLVLDQQHDFGYTENQNIMVEGFKFQESLATDLVAPTTPVDFLMKTPILKDAKDMAVGEYYILLGTQPMKNYISGENFAALRDELLELPAYTTMDLE